MNSDEKPACCCAVPVGRPECSPATVAPKPTLSRYVLLGLAGLAVWWLVYRSLATFAAWFTYSLLTLPLGSHLGATVEFFVYEAPKVLMLLTLVVFGVGIVRTFFTPERTRRILSGRRETTGNVLAFMMSGIALSLPEGIILRKVLKPRLIATSFGVVAVGILLVGYLFNVIM
jgi:uncharacterized membrane protein YraQ (UPF0718 family)